MYMYDEFIEELKEKMELGRGNNIYYTGLLDGNDDLTENQKELIEAAMLFGHEYGDPKEVC